MKTEEFAPIYLQNGLVIRFQEQDNRYFGDYHRIRIDAIISVADDFPLPEGISRDQVQLTKPLEKMGVPTADLQQERSRLVQSFLRNTRIYLEREEFPQQLLQKVGCDKRKSSFRYGIEK